METVPLRRLFTVVNGGTPTPDPSNWDGGVAWATPIDLAKVDGGSIDNTERTLTVIGLASGSRTVPSGALVLSTRAPIGYIAEAATQMAFNQGCRALVPRDPEAVDVRFVKYQLSARRRDLQSAGNGTTFQELPSEALGSFVISYAPMREQRRIADFLDAETSRIDALIAAKQQMIDVMGRRLKRELDDRLSARPAPMVPLRRFVRSLTQGTSGVAGSSPAEDGEWGILKLSAVKDGQFRERENKVLGPDFPVDASLRPQVGDLLVTRSNTPAYVGDVCAVLGAAGQVLLPDLIYRLRLDDRLDPAFASMALRTTTARLALSSAARGTSQSMVKLRGEDILNVVIPAPSIARQKSEVTAHDRSVEIAGSLARTLTRQIELLRERRQALITAAVTGEMEV